MLPANDVFHVGFVPTQFYDDARSSQNPLYFMYPTKVAPRVERFGPYEVNIAADGPVEGEDLPLVAISHGNGGSPWPYRELAAYLVKRGFVVALFEHLGNSRSDNSLEGTIANLENRPRQLQLAVASAFSDPRIGKSISKDGFAVIGHSMGGYTALALAGGEPTAFEHETANGQRRAVTVVHDARIRALVLMAPAAAWYAEENSLAKVNAPILMLSAEHDSFAPAFHGEIIMKGIGDRVPITHETVQNAGHFAFMSPFPAEMSRPDFPPAQDPPGFDRAAYQPILQAKIEKFLRAHLLRH